MYVYMYLVLMRGLVYIDYWCTILFAVLFDDNVLRGDNNAQAPGGMGSLAISFCKYDSFTGFETSFSFSFLFRLVLVFVSLPS